ncbi:MAG: hypothetical protein AABX51_04710, partial [Nanoarchaeota archaeon]
MEENNLHAFESKFRSRIFRLYFPYFCAMFIGFAVINKFSALIFAIIFFALQLLFCELNYLFGEDLWINRLKLDVAPFAAIFLAYYHSFLSGIISMFVLVMLQDFDRETSKFAEMEDFFFNTSRNIEISKIG